MAFDTAPDISTLFGGGRKSFLDALMSPEGMAAAVSGGLGVGQAFLQNRSNANLQREQQVYDRQALLAQLLNGANADQQGDYLARQQAHMNTFAMNPVAQQRHLFTAGVLGDLAQRGPTRVGGGGVSNPFQTSAQTQGYVQPDALAEAASRFYGAAGALNPQATPADLSAMGFGQAGAARQQSVHDSINRSRNTINDLNTQRRSDLINMLQQGGQGQQGGPAPEGYEYDKKTGQLKKKGGGFLGFLKKALPIASMAIPFVGPGIGLGLLGATSTAALGAGAGIGSQLLAGRGGGGGAMPPQQDYFTRKPVMY